MTSLDVAQVPRPAPRGRQEIPRWDQQLRQAKNEGAKVKFQLAVEAYFADDECVVIGTVVETDKAGIKIVAESTGKEHWISKSQIVGTEVLDAE